jgi:hypothetical protein
MQNVVRLIQAAHLHECFQSKVFPKRFHFMKVILEKYFGTPTLKKLKPKQRNPT